MEEVFSVSVFTRRLKQAMAVEFGRVSVEGEISNFTAHRSGHWYFSIKDSGATLSCVMFRGNNQRMRWQPQVGDQVVIVGGIDVYAPHGKYNLIARQMMPAGAGDLQQQLEALKRKLAAEGLFDPNRKRPLPSMPRAIGVATSATGAALHDIIKVLDRRFPGITVYLAPCRVQGEGAANEIIGAIRRLCEHGKSEVLIVGRGGGSQEDLFCFNDERLARAIAASSIPIVSAVGHEVDVSIADLVADVRAATPSHAAEIVVPERESILLYVDDLGERLLAGMNRSIGKRRDALDALVLRHPRRKVMEGRSRNEELGARLRLAMTRDLKAKGARVQQVGGRLEALSPLAVLSRGYAVVECASGSGGAVRSADDLRVGQGIHIRLGSGALDADVTALQRVDVGDT